METDMRFLHQPPYGTPYYEVEISKPRRRTVLFNAADEATDYAEKALRKMVSHPTSGPTVNGKKILAELRVTDTPVPRKHFNLGRILFDKFIEHQYSGPWMGTGWFVRVTYFFNK